MTLLLALACFGGRDFAIRETGIRSSDGAFFPDSGLDDACDELSDGALFTLGFDSSPDLVVWIEDDRFIDWYLADQGGTPVFGGTADGAGCSDEYAWHPLPAPAEWSMAPTDCDADDKDVEDRPAGPWCPTVQVLSFEDRR